MLSLKIAGSYAHSIGKRFLSYRMRSLKLVTLDSDLNYRFSYGDLHDQFYPNGIQDISAHGDTICFLSAGNVLCYKINLPD